MRRYYVPTSPPAQICLWGWTFLKDGWLWHLGMGTSSTSAIWSLRSWTPKRLTSPRPWLVVLPKYHGIKNCLKRHTRVISAYKIKMHSLLTHPIQQLNVLLLIQTPSSREDRWAKPIPGHFPSQFAPSREVGWGGCHCPGLGLWRDGNSREGRYRSGKGRISGRVDTCCNLDPVPRSAHQLQPETKEYARILTQNKSVLGGCSN